MKEKKNNAETEAFYNALIENGHDAIFLSDEHFNVIYQSPSACHITGWTARERLKENGADQTHPDDIAKLQGAMKEVLSEPGKPIPVMFRTKHKEGHYIIMEGIMINLLEDENVKGIVSNLRDITDRTECEEDLKKIIKETSDYKYALDECAIVAITDEKGIIKHANYNFCKTSKYAMDELVAQPDLIINSEYHPEEFIRNVWDTIANGEIWRGELKSKTKDGFLYWVDTSIVPFLNEQGKPYQYVVIRADITERKRVEENLENSLKEVLDYKYALDESSIVAVTDQHGIINHVNHNFCKISKYSADELIGQDHRIINSGYHSKEFIRNLWVTIANGKIWKGELKNKARDGTIYWVDTTIVPFLNEQGKPYKYVAICADITGRKLGEEESQIAHERLLFHIENTPLGFIEWDNHLRMKSLSKRAEEIFGWSLKDFIKNERTGYSQTYEQDRPWVSKIAEQLIAGKVEKINIQHRNYTKDGRIIWCEWFNSTVKNKDGKVISILTLVQDITERKKAEQEIIKVNEELRLLAAHLQSIREEERVHIAREIHDELGQQLTGLKIDLSWVDKKLHANDSKLKEKISSMLGLVDETVKTVRRIASDLRPGILDDFGLTAALEWQSQEFEKRTGINCIFTTDFSDETIERSIATGLFRIYQETLTNIARHSHATKVKSVFNRDHEHMTLLITDNGIGFNTEETKSKLTLGIVGMKERALMMKGDLTVYTITGKGTSVKVKVPLSLNTGS